MVRTNASAALTVVLQLAQQARAFSDSITKMAVIEREKIERWIAYEQAALQGTPIAPLPKELRKPLDIADLTNLLNRSADYAQKITHCARQAMEMERLYLGEPLAIIGVVDEQRRDIPIEEVQLRADNALKALEGARKAGGLRLIAGGKGEPAKPQIGQRFIPR
ncbi:MAG: hypothetical protein HC771_24040 [Synechococcales cyanobacterium CRU_2_2]|nr:hypothetical protein [Synechococcales cyanobacterium CRU_2_2]